MVRRGQTLWRISKVYGVEIDELASANGISDTSSLKTGQVLFIPGASEVRDVPAYPAPLDAATAIVPPGTVEDDGNGFDPEEALGATPTGGGFGLFSVMERIQFAGGRIEIDAAPGRGTRITMDLPMETPAPATPPLAR